MVSRSERGQILLEISLIVLLMTGVLFMAVTYSDLAHRKFSKHFQGSLYESNKKLKH